MLEHKSTAILDPTTTLLAPVLGIVTGAAAGIYQAARAARIFPLDVLQR